jgi:Uma2 family endonuclease
MLLHLHLPNHDEALATNRQRWREVLEDPQWHDYAGRIETNGFGQIVVSPPPNKLHSVRQGAILVYLHQELGRSVLAECPISTIDGVKSADVSWCSPQRLMDVGDQAIFEVAPEICVEVLSPSNTFAEMQAKRQLYFAAGAEECWVCDLDGRMTYYHIDSPGTPMPKSKRCPHFPDTINDN